MRSEALASQLLQRGASAAAVVVLSENTPGETLLGHGFRAVLMAAFPYSTAGPKDLSRPEDPHVRLAPFARANYYRAALTRMKGVVRGIRGSGEWSKGDFRIFVNSELPEKALALQAGLGFQGRNGLILTPKAGSLVVLAGLALPFVPQKTTAPPLSSENCGSCRHCIEACPTGAICPGGGFIVDRCLQALSTRPFPERYWEFWGNRLYGCQICQEVCPHNGRPQMGIQAEMGVLGPSLSLKSLLSQGEGVKEGLKGSVLDRRWIRGEDLLRNALIAAGNHPYGRAVEKEVTPYLDHENSEIRRAALWAWKRLMKRGRPLISGDLLQPR